MACRQLADGERAEVSVLEFRLPADPSYAEFDATLLTELMAWDDGQKYFCLTEPLTIRSEAVVLLAPLAG